MPRSSWAAGRRLLSCAAAVALAISMIPAAAFATDGGTSQLNTTVATGRAASDVPNINVDVPAKIALNDTTDPKGINIKNLGTVTGSAEFTNNSNNAIRIKEIKSNSSGLNSYFTLADAAQVTFSLGTTTTTNGNSTFTSVASANWKPTETSATSVYTVGDTAKPSEGFVMSKGAKMDGKVDLNLTGSTLKDAAKTAAQDPTADRDLIKCTWVIESVRGMGNAEDPNVDFYLTDKRNADHPVTYSLAEVKEDAEKLPSQTRGAWPYDMYYEFCTGDGSNYECKVRWNNELYSLRIIGLNQDNKADKTGVAGLTFQFTKALASMAFGYPTDWKTSNPRNYLSTGDGYKLLADSLKAPGVIKTVTKKYTNQSSSAVAYSDDGLFLLSAGELRDDDTGGAVNSKTGKNYNERYLFYQKYGSDDACKFFVDSLMRNTVGANNSVSWWSYGGWNSATWGMSLSLMPAFCL